MLTKSTHNYTSTKNRSNSITNGFEFCTLELNFYYKLMNLELRKEKKGNPRKELFKFYCYNCYLIVLIKSDQLMLVLYPASVVVSSVVSSCFICELILKVQISRNTLLSVSCRNPKSNPPCLRNSNRKYPPCLRISISKNPPCPRNSKKPSLVWFGYFLESPN